MTLFDFLVTYKKPDEPCQFYTVTDKDDKIRFDLSKDATYPVFLMQDLFLKGQKLSKKMAFRPNLHHNEFIPYERVKLLQVPLEIKGDIQEYMCGRDEFYCLRGTCSRCCEKCHIPVLDILYLKGDECHNGVIDKNFCLNHYHEIEMILVDCALWLNVCPDIDVVIWIPDQIPFEEDEEFDIRYSWGAIKIKSGNILVTRDKDEAYELYREYQTKYPTKDFELGRSFGVSKNFKY
jgi:hypothetical protein